MITKLAIEKNRVTTTAMVLIIILGILAFYQLPKAEDPGYIVRKARVVTLFPGASPERIEQLVTDKLEKTIQEMPELEFLQSQSRTGVSVITVKIWDRYKQMQPIWDTLRRKVERTTSSLPKGVVGPFVNDEFGDVFGTIITVTGDGYSYRELKGISDRIRDELLYLEEVAKVEIYGAQEERIFIEYNDFKLAELGTSSLQVKEFLESRNIVIPGGAISTEKERIFLEPSGNFESLDDLRNTVVNISSQKQLVYLKDLATVTRGYIDPPTNIMHFSGNPCLGLAVSLREGGNITKLGEEVTELIERLEKMFPIGINLDFVVLESQEVTKRVDTFILNLFQSVCIVMAIMLASLGFRTGIVVAGLIPMTILLTFILMAFFKIGIDQTSLAALIIALGMLVDNAIVMSESIFSEVARGKDPKQAAIDAAAEHRTSLLTSSLSTSLAFLPIFMAKSMAGEYTASLFKVVTIALLSSWVLSLTMIPMLCVHFLKLKRKETDTENWIYVWYKKNLIKKLRQPWKQLGIFAGIFVITLSGFLVIPKAFFPPSDRPLFTIKYELPVGTKIERTQEVIRKIENYFLEELMVENFGNNEGIDNWATFIGGVTPRYVLNSNPTQLGPEEVFTIVNTKSAHCIPELMVRIEKFATTHFPEIRISLEPTKYGPPVSAPVAVRISGDDQDQLFVYASQIKEKLSKIRGTKNIRDDWGASSKKIIAHVNQPRALRAGITSRDVAISMQTMLSGFDTTQYRVLNDVIPVILRSVSSDRENLDKLETLNVYSQSSNISVPLKQVADLKLYWQPNNILRRNRKKTVTVMADVDQGYHPQKISNSLKPWLDKEQKQWNHGYFYEFGGEKESSETSSQSIIEQIPFAALIIILLLVAQFNSFRHALIIMMTIPMGIIGVVIGLLLTNSYLGFMTFLGLVSLSGIVINDAIVLLERIQMEKDLGQSSAKAVIEAAQRRMRPILLTTFTTVGGMLPLWIGGSPMFKPMAIAIIFGLIFATLLILVFVPVLYSIFYHVSYDPKSRG